MNASWASASAPPVVFAILVAISTLFGCGSTASGTGGGAGGGKALSTIGDDCISDSQCASGLCDDNGSCAAPVATKDGLKCTADTDCPAADHCDSTTGQCFSAVKDGTGMGLPCTSDADCAGDETCGPDAHCQG